MENNLNSDEINLKQLGKKVVQIFSSKRRTFGLIFIITMLLASVYFVKIIVNPSYKSEVILKTKFINIKQLEACFEKYNSFLGAPNTNPVDPEFGKLLMKSNITRFEISEINADPKDKDLKYRLYSLVTFYGKKPEANSEQNIDATIRDIQNFLSRQNEIVEHRKRLKEGIIETDSLIKIAFNAGNNMKNRIQENGQMLVLSDIYNSISGILSKKEAYQIELAFYNNDNLIFKASPVIISKKIKVPLMIYIYGFLFWAFICGVWIMGSLVFGGDD
jgi:hypothetical protein